MKIDSEKAYLLGLIIGGGVHRTGRLQIEFPFRNWGDISSNPERGGEIATDIMGHVKPLLKLHYGIDIAYKLDKGRKWKVIFEASTSKLESDLTTFGIASHGEYRYSATIDNLVPALNSQLHKQQFLAGLVDTVGSLETSHRRFSDKFQVVSFEFKGFNFGLVSSVVRLLTEIGCNPDQVLWNHPNQHSGLNRYYRDWKKGFKVRVALDDYILKGSFAFKAKRKSAKTNSKLQSKPSTTVGKPLRVDGRTCLHCDSEDASLPEFMRGYQFVHFSHIAEFLGIQLPNAESFKGFAFENHVTPFTILTKGTAAEIAMIVLKEEYLRQSRFKYFDAPVRKLIECHERNGNALLFGTDRDSGFPINYMLQGISYVYCARYPNKVMGKRVRQNYIESVKGIRSEKHGIRIGIPNRATCVLVTDGTHSALIGFFSPAFNRSLIERSGIKIKLRNPTFESCNEIPQQLLI